MNIRMIIISTFLLMFISGLGFSVKITEVVFPFKAFVYQGARVAPSDVAGITITKETYNRLEFTYLGKSYKASLMSCGAIYLERQDQNPLLISFDVRDYRLDSLFLLKSYIY